LSDELFRYRPDILERLLRHGVRPTPSTRPELVHEFVSDLYRYEIRRLRARLLAGEFPRIEYSIKVVQLRMRYPVISMRARQWLVQ
jgi:hypothetical protein